MLDDGAGGDISQPSSGQAVALHRGAEYRSEHVLVADRGICGVRPRERDAHAAHDGDAPHCCADEHEASSGHVPEAGEVARSAYATIARPVAAKCSLEGDTLALPRLRAVFCSTRSAPSEEGPPTWATSPPSWPATAMSFRPISQPRRAARAAPSWCCRRSSASTATSAP